MSQTAAHLVDHVVPHVPVRQWVLSLPIPLRVLLAAQPELVTPVLQVVQRVVERHLLDHTGLKSEDGQGAKTFGAGTAHQHPGAHGPGRIVLVADVEREHGVKESRSRA